MNANNQLSGSPYQYDAAGNMTNDGNHAYFYDAESRLIQVDGTLGTCSTATACYTYDAFGRRVRKVGTGVPLTTDYAYDLSGNVISEFAPTCSGGTVECLTVGYLYLGGSPIAEYKNSTTYFAHPDHLGSTRLLTGMNQSVVQNLDYLPFGELNSSDSGTTTRKFTGDERDSETNLDHTWFRQYSSQLGRWMHPDPAGLAAVDPSNPQSWNRYSYVLNNPLANIDPTGLYCQWDDGTSDDSPADGGASYGDCVSQGGTWVSVGGYWSDPTTYCDDGGCRIVVLTTGVTNPQPNLPDPQPSRAWTFTMTFVSNFFSPSFYAQEFKQGGCLNTFAHATGNALVPSPLPSLSSAAGAGTMAVSATMRYNAAQAYAASRANVLGGQGLIYPQKSIPYNNILEGSAVTSLVEGGLGYVDGALFQGLLSEAEAAYNGNCH